MNVLNINTHILGHSLWQTYTYLQLTGIFVIIIRGSSTGLPHVAPSIVSYEKSVKITIMILDDSLVGMEVKDII